MQNFRNDLSKQYKWSALFEKGGEDVINKCEQKLGCLKKGGEGLFD